MGHGLFAVDVLAGAGGIDGHGGVQVVGGGDDDKVDVLVFEQAAVVAVGLGAGALGGALGALVEDVANSGDLDVFDFGHFEQLGNVIAEPTDAAADDARAEARRGAEDTRGRQGGSGERSTGNSAHTLQLERGARRGVKECKRVN